MGAADAEVFPWAAADPAPGIGEHLDGRVDVAHLGYVDGIAGDAKLVVQGSFAAGRAGEAVLVELIQREGDFAHGVDLVRLFSPAGRGKEIQAEEEG